MFELRRTNELMQKYEIPKQTVAITAGIAAPQVTLYLQGGKVSTAAEMRINQAVRDIGRNATQQFTATAKDSGGNTVTGVTFTWASSSTSVATINASGLATPVAVGTTQITASAGSATSSPDLLTVTLVPTFVSGTASLGAPVAGATVTLEDKAGNSVTTTTDANGKYSLPTAGLTPPFIIRVVTATASGSFPAGTTLYSVSADALVSTTINTHVLTDLILRSYFSAQGVNPDTAFGNPVANPAPTPLAVQTLAGPVIQAFQLWFNNNNVNVVAGTPSPTQFNMITSSLTANNSGFDKVLHQTTETVSGGQVAQLQTTDGTTTQTAALSYNTTANAFTISSTTTNGTATSSNSVSGVASTPAQQSAQTAIRTLLTNLASLVNSKGSTLAASDVITYLASDFLDGGLNQSLYASAFVNAISGATAVTFTPSFQAINLTNGTARTTLAVTLTAGGVTQTSTMPYFFELSAGNWLIRGNQQIITISNNGSLALTNNIQGNVPSGSTGVNTVVEAAFSAPEIPLGTATVTGGKVSGGTDAIPPAVGTGIFNNVAIPAQNKEVDNGITNDGWSIDSSPLVTALPNATPFRFNITCTGAANLAACQPIGSVVTYTFPVNGFTNESISITAPSAGLLSSAVGHSLTVTSTLPKLNAIAQINLEAFTYDGTPGNPATTSCDIVGIVTPPANGAVSVSGQITIPAMVTCESPAKSITNLALRMQVIGNNGETTQAMFWF